MPADGENELAKRSDKEGFASIFLSYARGDDEPFVKRLYSDLTKAGFAVWFDRVSMASRSLTFHQEIRDAIAARERLILVVGPKAITYDYVMHGAFGDLQLVEPVRAVRRSTTTARSGEPMQRPQPTKSRMMKCAFTAPR